MPQTCYWQPSVPASLSVWLCNMDHLGAVTLPLHLSNESNVPDVGRDSLG